MPSPPGAGKFGELLGIELLPEAPDGAFECAMTLDERHGNFEGVTHGGVQMTLLDVAMAGAIRRTLAPDEACASISITTDFLRAAPKGRVVARGRVDKRGATAAFASGELLDAAGQVCSRGTGVWVLRKRVLQL